MANVPSYGIPCGTLQPKVILDFLKMSNLAFSLSNRCVVYWFIKNIWNSFTFSFLFFFQLYIANKKCWPIFLEHFLDVAIPFIFPSLFLQKVVNFVPMNFGRFELCFEFNVFLITNLTFQCGSRCWPMLVGFF